MITCPTRCTCNGVPSPTVKRSASYLHERQPQTRPFSNVPTIEISNKELLNEQSQQKSDKHGLTHQKSEEQESDSQEPLEEGLNIPGLENEITTYQYLNTPDLFYEDDVSLQMLNIWQYSPSSKLRPTPHKTF